MRSELLVLLLTLWAGTSQCAGDLHPDWFVMNGTDQVRLPEIDLAYLGMNMTYPSHLHPVYQNGSAISGCLNGSFELANSSIDLCLSDFDPSSILNASSLQSALSQDRCARIDLNSSGRGEFVLPSQGSGIYALTAAAKNHTISAMPLLVLELPLSVDAPKSVRPGEDISVKVTLPERSFARPLLIVAVILSNASYDNSSLSLVSGDCGMNATMEIDGSSREISADNISMAVLMDLLMLMPSNSGIALPDLQGGEASSAFITDRNWEEGSYILTCLAVTEDMQLAGVSQVWLEVAN